MAILELAVTLEMPNTLSVAEELENAPKNAIVASPVVGVFPVLYLT